MTIGYFFENVLVVLGSFFLGGVFFHVLTWKQSGSIAPATQLAIRTAEINGKVYSRVPVSSSRTTMMVTGSRTTLPSVEAAAMRP